MWPKILKRRHGLKIGFQAQIQNLFWINLFVLTASDVFSGREKPQRTESDGQKHSSQAWFNLGQKFLVLCAALIQAHNVCTKQIQASLPDEKPKSWVDEYTRMAKTLASVLTDGFVSRGMNEKHHFDLENTASKAPLHYELCSELGSCHFNQHPVLRQKWLGKHKKWHLAIRTNTLNAQAWAIFRSWCSCLKPQDSCSTGQMPPDAVLARIVKSGNVGVFLAYAFLF